MPVTLCPSPLSAPPTTPSLGLRVSGTWNDGRGRGILDSLAHESSMLATSATPGSPARPFAPQPTLRPKYRCLRRRFETWQVLRVCLRTDVRNQLSRAAIERIGGKFEGIFPAHQLAAGYTPRDSAHFSIRAIEWPVVKQRVGNLMEQA